jgi:hypothetical protein
VNTPLNTLYEHRQDAEETTFGRRIQLGEEHQKGDKYDDLTTGKWELVPDALIGKVVEENSKSIFIRPAK